MPTAASPKLTAQNRVESSSTDLQHPIPQRYENTFDLDDAFSVHEEEGSLSFEFDSNSFLKDLESRITIGATDVLWEERENPDDEVVDLQNDGEAKHNSTSTSVSTLDMNAVMESHRSSSTPPPTSSSSQTMNSDALQTPDDSPPPELTPQFASITISPSPSHSQIREVEHAYPSVIIDASKTQTSDIRTSASEFPASISQRTSDSGSPPSQSTAYPVTSSLTPANVSPRRTSEPVHQHPSTSAASISSPVHRSTLSVSTPNRARISGPSTLQKVVSKTRPPYLPPKRKEEDEKHSREWEEMMQRSRLGDRKRREELLVRRLAREQAAEANTFLWDLHVMPDWKKAIRDPNLRKLWWNGVPTKLRSTIWERAVGNGLALSKNSYASTLSRAKSLLASRRFPTTALSLMESDIASTLPELHIFHRSTGPLYNDLCDLLCAWVVCRADEGLGYVHGAAKIAGMLLLNLTGPAQAFLVMRNLLERSCLRAFYGGPAAREDVEAYYRIFDTLLADGMPKVYFNFKQHQIPPAEYLRDWILPLFLEHLPLEACSRIWDVLLLEGDAFLFRAALAVLASMESRLFFPDRQELLAVLKGESKAAIEVAKRDPLSPLNVMKGPRYEIYNLNEEIIWERLMEMTEWWKENTWQRLIQRELPDV